MIKLKLSAVKVISDGEAYLEARAKRIKNDIDEAAAKYMKPRFWNLWRGQSYESALRSADRRSLYMTVEQLSHWSGGFEASLVEESIQAARVALAHGDGTMWIDDEHLFFIKP